MIKMFEGHGKQCSAMNIADKASKNNFRIREFCVYISFLKMHFLG